MYFFPPTLSAGRSLVHRGSHPTELDLGGKLFALTLLLLIFKRMSQYPE